MSDFQQMARVLAPVLVTLMGEPFWVGVFRPALDVAADPAGPALDFWVGPGFENWRPNDDYVAIIAVTTARAFAVPTPVARRTVQSQPAPEEGGLVWSVPSRRRGKHTRHWCSLGPAAGGRRASGRAHAGQHLGQVWLAARPTMSLRPGTEAQPGLRCAGSCEPGVAGT